MAAVHSILPPQHAGAVEEVLRCRRSRRSRRGPASRDPLDPPVVFERYVA